MREGYLGLPEGAPSTFDAFGNSPCSKLVYLLLAGKELQSPYHSQNRRLCALFWDHRTNHDSFGLVHLL